jgi:DNA polymerase-3 subunit delta
MSIYFFYGDEEYNIELEIKKLKKKLLDKNFASINFQTVDNPSFSELILLLRTPPMMFGNLMIVIDCENYFSKSFEDFQLEQISQALEDNIENLCIIFRVVLAKNEKKKIDSRRKIYKIISKYSQMHEFSAFKFYETDKILNWVTKEAKKQEIIFEKDATLNLIGQIGNNLRQLVQEIEKLKLLAYPKTLITSKMVKEICISNEDLFIFADYLLKSNNEKALSEFHKLLEKKHPLEILSALQTMLRKWIIIKLKSKELSLFEIAKLTGQQEYVVKTTLAKIKDVKLKDLVRLKQNLLKAEYNIKSGQSVDNSTEIEMALFI